MQRRDFITILSGSAILCIPGPFGASAQATDKIYRLGTIGPRDPFDEPVRLDPDPCASAAWL